jgi:hypothetical protein
LTNRLVVHPQDFPEDIDYVRLKGRYVLGIVYVDSVKSARQSLQLTPAMLYASRDNTGSLQPREIGPSKHIRQWVGLSMQGEQVEVEVYEPQNGDWAGNVDLDVSIWCRRPFRSKGNLYWRSSLCILQIGFHIKKTESHEVYDTEQLAQVFITVSSRSFRSTGSCPLY